MKRNLAQAFIILTLTVVSFGQQPQTGTFAFGSFTSGPEVIDLANNNVMWTIPIRHKPGRHANFDYDLTYNSSVWKPVTSGSTTSWQLIVPATIPGVGWQGLSPFGSSYISYSMAYSYGTCGQYGTSQWQQWSYGTFQYWDSAFHTFNINGTVATNNSGGSNQCPPVQTAPPSPWVATASDGSGFTMTVTPGQGSVSISLKNKYGTTISAPVYVNGGPPSTGIGCNPQYPNTDIDGNEITCNNGSYTDTMNTVVLGVAGAPPSSNTVLSYNAPSGAPASYTVWYTYYTIASNFAVSGISEFGATPIWLVDHITLPDGSSYKFTYEPTPSTPSSGACTPKAGTYSANCVTARIASVTIPTGGTFTYTYSGGDGTNGSGIFSDGSTANLQIQTPDGTWAYNRTRNGSNWQTSVTAPKLPYDSAANQTIIQFSSLYEVQRQVYQGSSTSGTLLETQARCYYINNTGNCVTTGVIPTSVVNQVNVSTQLSGGSASSVTTKYDSYYNPTEIDVYDYPNEATLLQKTLITYTAMGCSVVEKVGSVTVQDGSGTTVRQTTYTYDQGTPTASSGTPQHVASPCPNSTRGNLTTISSTTQGTSQLTKTFTYYDTGMIKTATDVNGAVTTYNYPNATATCGNTFPTSLTVPIIGTTPTRTYNCIGGVTTQIKDLNGNATNTAYSDQYYWRPASVTDPLGAVASFYYQPNPTYPTPFEVFASLTFNNGTSMISNANYEDTSGRVYTEQSCQSPSCPDTVDTVSYTYDNVGRPYTASMPCVTGYTGTCSGPQTTTTYDALSRPTQVKDGAGGTVSYQYNDNDVLQTTGPGQTFEKQYEYDGLGRITSVCEVTTATGSGTCGQKHSQQGFWTRYKYDGAGHITGVCQNTTQPLTTDCVANPSAGQQTRIYSYDLAGRLTLETNPESGTTRYFYDSDSTMCGNGASTQNGDLVKTTDAANNCAMYYHDALHRVTDIGNNNQAANGCRRYRYDNSTGYAGSTKPSGITNTIGRLEEVATDACSTNDTLLTDEWFSYDADGDVTNVWESTPHSGGYYHSQANYWPTGAVESVTVMNSSGSPVFPTVYYGASDGSGLDGEGRITKVTASSGTNPVSSITYATNNSTTAFTGLLTGISFPSGDSDNFTYDPSTGRQVGYTFSVNGVTDTGTMTWNANGTLGTYAIVDHLSSSKDTQTCNYFYDDLARLGGKNANGWSVDCGSTHLQDLFGFDPFGNISKSGTYNFNATYATATNHISGMSGVQYDADGNLTQDNLGVQYTWSVYGNPRSINSTNLVFDAMGQMVEQQNGSAYTQMVYSQVGKTAIMNGQTLQKAFLPLPGGETAIYNSSGTLAYYRHTDWLGNSRLTTTTSRTVYSDSAYAPFGEQYDTSGTADPSFTGEDSDSNSNLYDFTFREYSPSQGRWVSPDPAGVSATDPANPQSWNRYTYVLNNPMGLVDPVGLDCVTATEDGSILINSGDCPGVDPNNEYYYDCDGCLMNATSAFYDQNGDLNIVIGTVNGGPLLAALDNFDYSGPVPQLGQANSWLDPNSTLGYYWNFTGSFFGGLVSSAGWTAVYHSTFDEGGCDNLMFSTFAETLNPLPGGGPEVSDVSELGPKAVMGAGQTVATAYSVYKGLSVPLRSSIYRGLQSSTYSTGAAFEEAAPYALVGYAGGKALVTAGSAAYNGECF